MHNISRIYKKASAKTQDRTELLRSGLIINNQKKSVKDYINQDKLVYKCFTCYKIGHRTKNCNLKTKLCSRCNSAKGKLEMCY